MAIYFTLAVDCADNKAAAHDIASRFDGYEMKLCIDGKTERVACTSEAYSASQYWGQKNLKSPSPDWMIVTVTQPIFIGGSRDDLLTQPNLELVRNDLYDRLAGRTGDLQPSTGYRAARFGVESQDFLGDDDWLKTLGRFLLFEKPQRYFEGLILDATLVRNPSLRQHLVEFSPGYLWWDCFPERYY